MYRDAHEVNAFDYLREIPGHIDMITTRMPHPRDFMKGDKNPTLFGDAEENTHYKDYHHKIIRHLEKNGLEVHPIYKNKSKTNKDGTEERLHSITIRIPRDVEHSGYFPPRNIPVALHDDTMIYSRKRDGNEDIHDSMIQHAADYLQQFHDFAHPDSQ